MRVGAQFGSHRTDTHRACSRKAGQVRPYRIEYRPMDGWTICGEPLRADKDRRPPSNDWPVITTRATRLDAERVLALWQGRQLILLGVDLLAPDVDLPRTA